MKNSFIYLKEDILVIFNKSKELVKIKKLRSLFHNKNRKIMTALAS